MAIKYICDICGEEILSHPAVDGELTISKHVVLIEGVNWSDIRTRSERHLEFQQKELHIHTRGCLQNIWIS